MKVIHIQRRPTPAQFSLEGYFERVRSSLSGKEEVELLVVPFRSKGILRRIANAVAVWWKQSDVNHVTGDIHYAAILLKPSKTVLTVLDCQVLSRLTGWRRTLVKLLWYSLPMRCVSRVTVISEETKRRLLEEVSFPPERIHVIPVSVSPVFRPSPKEFDRKCPRILQVGTKPNKNVPRLLEALQGLSCQLEIVGPLDDTIRDKLESLRIHYESFTGLTEAELYQRYIEADIVSFVSTYEGFGMPIVEAQHVERVCVTSNCSSMPEVAGDGACFVDPFDSSSIREGILRVINDDEFRHSLIIAGRKNRARFNPAEIATAFSDLYRHVHETCNQPANVKLPKKKNP